MATVSNKQLLKPQKEGEFKDNPSLAQNEIKNSSYSKTKQIAYVIIFICLIVNFLNFINENYLRNIYSSATCEANCKTISSVLELIDCLDACAVNSKATEKYNHQIKEKFSFSFLGLSLFIGVILYSLFFIIINNGLRKGERKDYSLAKLREFIESFLGRMFQFGDNSNKESRMRSGVNDLLEKKENDVQDLYEENDEKNIINTNYYERLI